MTQRPKRPKSQKKKPKDLDEQQSELFIPLDCIAEENLDYSIENQINWGLDSCNQRLKNQQTNNVTTGIDSQYLHPQESVKCVYRQDNIHITNQTYYIKQNTPPHQRQDPYYYTPSANSNFSNSYPSNDWYNTTNQNPQSYYPYEQSQNLEQPQQDTGDIYYPDANNNSENISYYDNEIYYYDQPQCQEFEMEAPCYESYPQTDNFYDAPQAQQQHLYESQTADNYNGNNNQYIDSVQYDYYHKNAYPESYYYGEANPQSGRGYS